MTTPDEALAEKLVDMLQLGLRNNAKLPSNMPRPSMQQAKEMAMQLLPDVCRIIEADRDRYGKAQRNAARDAAWRAAWTAEPLPEHPVPQEHLSVFQYGKDCAVAAIHTLKEPE